MSPGYKLYIPMHSCAVMILDGRHYQFVDLHHGCPQELEELELVIDSDMDIAKYNRQAWDNLVAKANEWTVPVTSERVDRARRSGVAEIVLTPQKYVPQDWLTPLPGKQVLCLAGGGGQQGPLLAAAGASVTVFDNSPAQLAQDEMVARRDDLRIETVRGDMRDLSCFRDGQFDLIVHPCSNTFIDDVRPVWAEGFRVLRPDGEMLTGFCNPVVFIFDYEQLKAGQLAVRYSVPYSDLTDLPKKELDQLVADGEAICFGHTLERQIGGQIDAGFSLVGFYEDGWDSDSACRKLSQYLPCFAATRARKPSA